MKKISLQTVADHVGVSVALVSYVLNGQKKDRIPKQTAERILAAARELNYRPNRIARSLQQNKSYSIGLIVADIANPFSSQLARVISTEAEGAGYTVLIGSSDENSDKFETLVNLFLDRQADGFILAATEGSQVMIETLKVRKVPFVLIDRYYPAVDSNVVTVDNYDASFDAVRRFIQSGRKKIGIVSLHTALYHMQERVKGAEDAIATLSDQELNRCIHFIDEDNLEEQMSACIDELVKLRVDALYFTSNKTGVCGLRQLIKKGIRVPEDIEFCTFDETEAFDFFPGTVNFIKQPIAELGQKGFGLLYNQFRNVDQGTVQETLKTTFIRKNALPFGV